VGYLEERTFGTQLFFSESTTDLLIEFVARAGHRYRPRAEVIWPREQTLSWLVFCMKLSATDDAAVSPSVGSELLAAAELLADASLPEAVKSCQEWTENELRAAIAQLAESANMTPEALLNRLAEKYPCELPLLVQPAGSTWIPRIIDIDSGAEVPSSVRNAPPRPGELRFPPEEFGNWGGREPRR